MKKILIVGAALAALVAFNLPAASASAASCSPSAAGGEKAPSIGGDNSINEGLNQGYSCTVQWEADVQPQYESGGTWHYCEECAPIFHPSTPDTFYAAGSGHNWGLFDWFATATGDTPACHYNWRLQVNFVATNRFVFQSDVSPQAAKTC